MNATKKTPATHPDFPAIAGAIALRELGIQTLKTRKCSVDFHELAVWSIEAALQAAFEAGRMVQREEDRKARSRVIRADGREVTVSIPD